MADAELSILIKARNEAKAEFDKLNTQVKGLQGSTGGLSSAFKGLDKALTGGKISTMASDFESMSGMSAKAALGIGAVAVAVMAIGKYAAASMKSFQELALAVNDFTRITGDSAENMSRIIDASNDLGIATETLKNAFVIASRNGFDVSLESLIKMAGEYKSLSSAMEKSQYIFERFGKSGGDIGRLFEGGAAGLKAYTDGVLNANIVTNKMIEDAKKFRDVKNQIDDLNDAFKNSVGRVAMEGWTQVLLGLTIVLGVDYVPTVEDATAATNALADAQAAAAAEQVEYQRQLSDLQTIMGGQFGKETKNYTDKLGDLKDEAAGLKAQIDELEGKKYLTAAQKKQLEELKTELGGVTGAMGSLAAEHTLAMKQMAANLLIQKVGSDGFTQNEINNIAEIMKAWGLWDEQTADVLSYLGGIDLDTDNLDISGLTNDIALLTGTPQVIKFDGETTPQLDKILALAGIGTEAETPVIDLDTQLAMTKAEQLIARMDMIKDRTATVSIDFNMTGGIGAAEKALNYDLNGNGIIGAAVGRHTGGRTLVGELGPEIVDLPPGSWVHSNRNSQSMGGGGGGVTVNLNYAPALSLSDKTEAESKLLPLIQRALSRAG